MIYPDRVDYHQEKGTELEAHPMNTAIKISSIIVILLILAIFILRRMSSGSTRYLKNAPIMTWMSYEDITEKYFGGSHWKSRLTLEMLHVSGAISIRPILGFELDSDPEIVFKAKNIGKCEFRLSTELSRTTIGPFALTIKRKQRD
jgi:hypothetical protein